MTCSTVVAVIAATVERILTAYKKLLEIRKLRSEMIEHDIPKSALADVDSLANNRMEEEVEAITTKLIEEHGAQHEAGRKNELHNSLRISLNKIVNRIDRGYHIEVRVGALLDLNDEKTEEDEKLAQQVRTIRDSAEVLRFVNTAGTPVLQLPEA